MFLKPGDQVSVADLNKGGLSSPVMTPVLRWLITLPGAGVIYWSDEWLCQKTGSDQHYFQTVHGLDAPGQFSTARDMDCWVKH